MSSIDGHRVASIEVADIVTRYPRVVGRNSRLGPHGAGPASTGVAVRTDQGAVGWGLAIGPVDDLDGLVGRPVCELIDPATGVLDSAALPLDYALHDLSGAILGQPVHQLLGGHGETSLHCYDGAIYLDDLDVAEDRALEVVLANVAMDYAAGFRAFKLKIGRGYQWMDPEAGLARDVEVTRAVRAAYPDVDILADANDGYSLADALRYLDGVADCGLFWLEEPFLENRHDLVGLRRYLDERGAGTLVADGEARPQVESLLELAADGLLDVLLMDVVSYGLTAWRTIMPALVKAGVKASPHAWGEPLKTLYAAQLGAGLGNVLTIEGVPGVTEAVDTSGYRLESGRLRVPDTPGFGIPLPSAFTAG